MHRPTRHKLQLGRFFPTSGVSLPQFIITVIAIVLCSSNVGAQTDLDTTEWENRLGVLETNLKDPAIDEAGAQDVERQALQILSEAAECVSQREVNITQLEEDLALIGEDPIEPEEIESVENDIGDAEIQEQADEIHLRRLAMENNITQLRINIQECRFIILQADKIVDSATKLQQTLSAQRLGAQEGNLFKGLKLVVQDPSLYVAMGLERLASDKTSADLDRSRLSKIFLALLLSAGLGYLGRWWLKKWSRAQRGRGGEPTILTVFARNISGNVPWIIATFVVSGFLYVYNAPDPFESVIFRFAFAAFLFAVLRTLIRWITGPYSPGSEFLNTPELPPVIERRLIWFVLALLAAFVLLSHNMLTGTTDANLWFLRSVLIFLIATTLIWAVRLNREIPGMRGKVLPLRLLIIAASVGAVIADFSGYRNLANHLIKAVLITVAAGLVLWTILWLIRTLLHGLVHGTNKASYQVRSWMGMRPAENRAELGWIRLIFGFSLWIAFAALLVAAWDPSGNLLPKMTSLIGQGIPIGEDKTLVLVDILRGLLVFGLLLALTAWIKARLSTRWLRDMGMDRGARDAIVTLSGYVGFLIAIITGLVLAGVDFTGLAVVVAALSVGIGFGLQNIIGNFVSGLILLFERPIKSGDFVSVGTVEGVIRQIRIRSTEIETLDRQTVIVPNSELVSTQVTNWVLHDPFGRLCVNVGVAYGSDTEKVRDILEQIAADNSEVLSKGPAPKPRALFTGFGDSSLDFELRVWVRHIEKRFQVTSQLNFAIDKAFRENGIEIPFPQRDLHVRSWTSDMPVDKDADFEKPLDDEDMEDPKEDR